MTENKESKLTPTLNTLHLWGIAVGLVISGEYFGWSYGWASAGTLGFLVISLLVAIMYTCLSLVLQSSPHPFPMREDLLPMPRERLVPLVVTLQGLPR